MLRAIEWTDDQVILIDQTKLPHELVYKQCTTYHQIAESIKRLEVRGAPAIGIAGAYGLVLGAKQNTSENKSEFISQIHTIATHLESTRPTAVNLSWALKRMLNVLGKNKDKSIEAIINQLLEEAKTIHKEDEEMCKSLGQNGAKLLKDGQSVLTHCNAGFLATGGIGTALSVIYMAHQQGKQISVFADETRPLLQGARLTVWELLEHDVDVTLICDDMAGWVMKNNMVDCVVLGADRIANNGDTANKIGTYSLAVLAHRNQIPFYVVAPSSTIDMDLENGDKIPIEERDPKEVRNPGGTLTTVENVNVYNPAFDVTESTLITAIITEKGIYRYPYNFVKKIDNNQ